MVTLIKDNEITLFPTPADLFQFAANDFAERAMAAVKHYGIFSVVLSGGNTPKAFFDVLAERHSVEKKIPWENILFFFGDERYVPADDEASNYHMAQAHLFSKVPVLAEHIYRIHTEFSDPSIAARDYEKIVREAFHLRGNSIPSFDLVYLGLGADAHTASLMPGSEIVRHYAEGKLPEIKSQLAAALFVPKLNMERITLTPPAINHAKKIIFLATGADKATAVLDVLKGDVDPSRFPAQLIQGQHEKTSWFLDEAAGALL